MELTIVIPVYNREKYLERTVRSVLDSRVELKALYLVDNNSTDGSLALCRKLAEEHDVIQVFTAKKQGAAVARNVGLDKCETEWIYFFDSDDIFTGLPGVENEEDYDVVCFPTRMVREDGKSFVRWFAKRALPEDQILGAFISTVSAIYRTAWLREKALRWNEELLMWDDWEFGARVLMNAPRIKMLRKAVCHCILLHDDSITGGSYAHDVKGKFRAIEQLDDYVSNTIQTRRKEICQARGLDYDTITDEELLDDITAEAMNVDTLSILYSLYLHCEITAGRVLHETKTKKHPSKCRELKGCYPLKNALFNAGYDVEENGYKKKATLLKALTWVGVRGTYRLALDVVHAYREKLIKTVFVNKKEK